MQTHLRGRDLITLQEWTKDELDTLVDVAFDLKRQRALGVAHPYLRDKVLAMLFFFSSTRTRASFEAGIAQLGGHGQFIESRTTQIAHGDTPQEIGEILGRYNDGLAIRQVDWQVGNTYMREVAEASRVPVLNMQDDLFHPHQALADLLTIIERLGDPRGRTATVSWAYAASYQKPISVPQDLVTLATRFGMHVRLVHPPELKLRDDVVALARILTGWTIDRPRQGGGFTFRTGMHDGGTKVLLGQTFGASGQAEGEFALDLLAQQTTERAMGMILITHDLGVVAGRTDHIAVMYAGRIVERAPTRRLFHERRHPYTDGLLTSIPRLASAGHGRLSVIPGRPPDLVDLPPGCPFAPRCRSATAPG